MGQKIDYSLLHLITCLQIDETDVRSGKNNVLGHT